MFLYSFFRSGLLYSFCDIEHVVFECLAVFFWFITSFESLNHHSVITSQVPVCYPVNMLSESGYNLTVRPVSSPPADN